VKQEPFVLAGSGRIHLQRKVRHNAKSLSDHEIVDHPHIRELKLQMALQLAFLTEN
jgi:hypothetical protein